ncbi:MAG: glycosyltransferase N-terminal domain-containing protein [Bacteroidota bacterium]
MTSFSRSIYNIGTGLYFLGIRVAALFDEKATKWVEGRSLLFPQLRKAFAFQKKNPLPVIWVHCASLGEFEQGRPIIERLKESRPNHKILLTFFSPSGYEIRKDYPLADWVFYLPPDSRSNAVRFIETVQPSLAIFVKYEFWYHLLNQLNKRSVPTILVAAVFRENQPFFKWYGKLHRKMLHCFSHVFVQDSFSKDLLDRIDIQNVVLAGDPRVDRVISIASGLQSFPEVVRFVGDHPVLVAGSTWKNDEVLLSELSNNEAFNHWKLIVVPHDISSKRIKEVKSIFDGKAVLYTELKNADSGAGILVVDAIGKLAWLYQFGKIAYIGGGFGKGIHNTLEPMAFNLPVIFGPKYQKFVEAKAMLKEGGHFSVDSFSDLLSSFQRLRDPKFYQDGVHRVNTYMKTNKGASQTITSILLKYL